MRIAGRAFLPERLRPRLRLVRRPSRRPLALIVAVPLVLALLPWWRIQAVEVEGMPVLPAAISDDLGEYVGTPTIGLDLREVRQRVEAWPGIDGADVRLELPGRLRVVARVAAPSASLHIGRSWHGVAADGSLTGTLAGPLQPVLEGFATDRAALRSALAVCHRIEIATGGTVTHIRAVAPGDFAVAVATATLTEPVIVVVGPTSCRAERYWAERVAAGEPPGAWCDARFDGRLVIGGAA